MCTMSNSNFENDMIILTNWIIDFRTIKKPYINIDMVGIYKILLIKESFVSDLYHYEKKMEN